MLTSDHELNDLVEAGETESLLIGDFASGTTRAILLERIAGSWRFVGAAVAPTTFDLPHRDLAIGWMGAVRALGQRTGRQLDDSGKVMMPQHARGDGVDTLLITSSLGDPVRVAVLDTGAADTTLEIIDALRDTHCRVLHASAPNARKEGGWVEAQSAALRRFEPEKVVLLLDGKESHAVTHVLSAIRGAGGSLRPREAVVSAEPVVLSEIRGLFGSQTKVTTVENVRERASDLAETLQRDVTAAWANQLSRDDVVDVLSAALLPPIPRATAVDLATRQLARSGKRQVTCVAIDEGSQLHVSSPDERDQLTLPCLDVRLGIADLTKAEIAEAARWLPFDACDDELTTWVLNRAMRPWTDLESPRDHRIAQALARQIIQRLARAPRLPGKPDLATSDLLVISGEVAAWPDRRAATLAIIDGLGLMPESGAMTLALDEGELMFAAGAASLIDPRIASDVLTHDALRHLGTVVVLSGSVKPGAIAAHLEIERDGQASEHVSIPAGELLVLPLACNQTARLTVKPARKQRLGIHPLGKQVKLGDDQPLTGGSIGLIIDARGRPLPGGDEGHAERVSRWLAAMAGPQAIATAGAPDSTR